MRNLRKKPTSPGEILREEFLKPLGITQSTLAQHLGCDVKVINRIINERSSVTADIAIGLAGAFETSPAFWLNAQQAIDLYQASLRKRKVTTPLTRRRLQGARAA